MLVCFSALIMHLKKKQLKVIYLLYVFLKKVCNVFYSINITYVYDLMLHFTISTILKKYNNVMYLIIVSFDEQLKKHTKYSQAVLLESKLVFLNCLFRRWEGVWECGLLVSSLVLILVPVRAWAVLDSLVFKPALSLTQLYSTFQINIFLTSQHISCLLLM